MNKDRENDITKPSDKTKEELSAETVRVPLSGGDLIPGRINLGKTRVNRSLKLRNRISTSIKELRKLERDPSVLGRLKAQSARDVLSAHINQLDSLEKK